MGEMTKRVRESNFELLRIVSMLFIILWHIIVHGRVMVNCINPAIHTYLEFIKFILVVHVNSFIVVMGYFQSKSKFRLSKLFSLMLQVSFYSLVIYLIFVLLGFVSEYNFVSFFLKILPSSIGDYWFIASYIIVYIFSDYINKFIDKLDRLEYKNLLLLSFVIFSIVPFLTGSLVLDNNGYNFYHFIFLYLLGGYLRRFPLRDSYYFKRFSSNGYRMFMIFSFFMMALFNYLLYYFAGQVSGYGNFFGEFMGRILKDNPCYSIPFVIIQTICYFEIFRSISFRSKLVNFISSCVFGVYLIHDNTYVRGVIYKILGVDTSFYFGYKKFFYLFVVMFVIFILCLLIELLRKFLFYLVSKIGFVKGAINSVKKWCLSFNFEINW